ncbi:hypothetical protein DY000_02058624 [Brassica cretica]|uniref:Retrotransposon Copia-like N-terminal domain-containing protein n=1 Tax=Brassica cretica TaxID=69181 RepID=A0ABQ7B2I8_BRACR|nr:hypothetical protein DY000_02058624 [Brassica cretica]
MEQTHGKFEMDKSDGKGDFGMWKYKMMAQLEIQDIPRSRYLAEKLSKQISNKTFHIEEGYETTTHHPSSTPYVSL